MPGRPTMNDLDLASVPGGSRVIDLFDEMVPTAAPRSRERPAPPRIGTVHGPALAALTLAAFLGRVNWTNRPPAPVMSEGPRVLLGSLTLSAFLGAVNWRNAANAPAWPGAAAVVAEAQPTADDVLREFVWE